MESLHLLEFFNHAHGYFRLMCLHIWCIYRNCSWLPRVHWFHVFPIYVSGILYLLFRLTSFFFYLLYIPRYGCVHMHVFPFSLNKIDRENEIFSHEPPFFLSFVFSEGVEQKLPVLCCITAFGLCSRHLWNGWYKIYSVLESFLRVLNMSSGFISPIWAVLWNAKMDFNHPRPNLSLSDLRLRD